MNLPEQLADCLDRLSAQCGRIVSQNDTLRNENEALKGRLDALKTLRHESKDSGHATLSNHTASGLKARPNAGYPGTEPPGTICESSTTWASVVPTQQPVPSGLSPRAWGAAGGTPGSRDALSDSNAPREESEPQKRLRLAVAAVLSDAAKAGSFDDTMPEELESSDKLTNLGGMRKRSPNKDVEGVLTPSGCGDGSLAAARLGKLVMGAKLDSQAPRFLDTFSLFNDRRGKDDDEQGGVNQGDVLIKAIASSMTFRIICTLAIAANAVYIGFSADYQVKNAYRPMQGLPKEPDWKVPDISFVGWFALELLIRIAAERRNFFYGEEYKWNLFDCFLVLNSILELLFPSVSGNFSFLRIFRVFRVVRVVRLVRTVKALKSLRTMVFALLNSFICLMWAFVMIILIMFVFGIIFDQAVAGYFDSLDSRVADDVQKAQFVHESFGTLYETMVSLLASITGGNDWMTYGERIRQLNHGELYFALFCFYICFCLVGMLNTVTGIFVDSAVCTRTEDEVVENFTEEKKRTSDEVRRIFKEADLDNSNMLSYQELARHLENPWVKAYFSGLDIDPSEVGIIFTLIDTDGSNSISIDEFVEGTMKLKGHAKSIDVLSMMFDTVRFSVRFDQLCSFIEEELSEIKEALWPERPYVRAKSLDLNHAPPLSSQNKFTRIRMSECD